MYIVQHAFLVSTIGVLQSIERMLDFLFIARPYIPFGAASLAAGFVIGFILMLR